MTLIHFLFYVMSFIAVASALYAALSKNLVRSIFIFFVTLFALAGLYVIALADFVAVTQVVIYVGGILVLILFAFMLSGRETLKLLEQRKSQINKNAKVTAVINGVLFLSVVVKNILKADADNLPWVKQAIAQQNEITPTSSTIDNIGINLMTTYLLPFETISVLLLMALVGAAHLSRKEGRA
jgi:NADH:ubiquinone oxidoreductase subunit 6 (subunit J)